MSAILFKSATKYDEVHQTGREDSSNGCFLARFHLQLCHADNWQQQDGNVTDQVDGAGDVARGRVVAPSRNEGIPSLRSSSVQIADFLTIAHAFRIGVHEKINTINVLRYAKLTATISAQLAQKMNALRCCLPSKMCLICSRMLIFAE
jgi:hypothetical protein